MTTNHTLYKNISYVVCRVVIFCIYLLPVCIYFSDRTNDIFGVVVYEDSIRRNTISVGKSITLTIPQMQSKSSKEFLKITNKFY